MIAAIRLWILIVQLFQLGTGQMLMPTSDSEFNDVNQVLLPNRRKSLTDCHFRYYKYGRSSIDKPVNGRPAYLREFAHMAAIGWRLPDNSIRWNCGGSLIWENWILTAAHCTEDENQQPPSVARFGDLNLYNDTDDQHAQQLKIVEIIRHPKHRFRDRYHDIALMRLEKNIELHDTVAPACLWNDDEIRFKTLQATGWGAIGFAEEHTPILLKVSLRPVEQEQCSPHYINLRGLRSGLHDTQMCAGDPLMDTCPGDSGGPLEVKLLHNTRITPFIVAVTSFGTACGHSVPGVYTRVAPYVPWIQSVLNSRGENVTDWMIQPQGCAIRYVEWREFEPRVVLNKGKRDEQLDLSYAHIFEWNPPQLASIHWNGQEPGGAHECFGVIMDENVVVTVARCTSFKGVPPAYVRYLNNRTNAVIRHYKHPNWTDGSLYNDVGVLVLRDPWPISKYFLPACIWEKAALPAPEFEVTGRGLYGLNALYDERKDAPVNNTINLIATVDVHGKTNCSLPEWFDFHLQNRRPAAEHLCFGADPFLVPGTCRQAVGGPLQREIMRTGRIFMYAYALNLAGRDCGFGESAIGVRLASHLPWLESILLPKEDDEDVVQPFIFLNGELKEGDTCTVENGGTGVCIAAANCPKVMHDFHQNRRVRFCRTGSLLCCPREHIRSDPDAEWRQIDSCRENQPRGEEDEVNFKWHTVSIEWTVGSTKLFCIGTMITSRIFLTAASCLDEGKIPEYVSLHHTTIPMITLMVVDRVVIHPEFHRASKRHNIALVTVRNQTEPSFGKLPACLWTNATHTPFKLYQTGITDEGQMATVSAFTKFNTDCRRPFRRALKPHELCLDLDANNKPLIVDEGMPAFWEWSGSKSRPPANYLIGFTSYSAPNDSTVLLHTRIAPYVSWIKSVL